ncbi:Dor1-like protein [Eremomyces bilateralis CBS 781.70]|uniref:Conserved oligomeric Golgi complex subunit 8 n=1 Tax=Eremomyces bilateralis CBS 781.70 TaxID=1392243 RepID=A0A6G1FQG0_9PEZI|nr:Dor1-like protein [Eremomyces bilateralis CBS 781.70]KAF1808034.1 Dor1-like protein [Eremomyces bilateralis CBS 781.70]
MADGFLELIAPILEESGDERSDDLSREYLSHLTSLSISDLLTDEPESLLHSGQTILRSLQALSRRTYKSSVRSVEHLDRFKSSLPTVKNSASAVQDALPSLESASSQFSSKYARSPENPVLLRRQEALNLYENASRISDILDLPALLSSIISSSSANASFQPSQRTPGGATQTTPSITSANISYASALDLHHHIKRLSTLFPESSLIGSMTLDADHGMNMMSTYLLTSLRSPNLKLTAAMRTIGLLRRVAPELESGTSGFSFGRPSDEVGKLRGSGGEGSLGAIFLVCRTMCLIDMLEALAPLRDLADQETSARKSQEPRKGPERQERWSEGQQTERYLKRYLEIFREQSFAIISMYRNIFPGELPVPQAERASSGAEVGRPGQTIASSEGSELPSALSTFPMHLVSMLMETLEEYLPNVQDRASRESLLTQVLYCAGSLGRLGADFGMLLALVEEDSREDEEDADEESEWEWVETVKKHRIQASRLELLASGVGTTRQVGRA